MVQILMRYSKLLTTVIKLYVCQDLELIRNVNLNKNEFV